MSGKFNDFGLIITTPPAHEDELYGIADKLMADLGQTYKISRELRASMMKWPFGEKPKTGARIERTAYSVKPGRAWRPKPPIHDGYCLALVHESKWEAPKAVMCRIEAGKLAWTEGDYHSDEWDGEDEITDASQIVAYAKLRQTPPAFEVITETWTEVFGGEEWAKAEQ